MALMLLTNSGHVALAQAVFNSSIYLAWGDLPPFLTTPSNVTAVSVAPSSSSLLTATTYYYSVSALTANGETPASTNVSVVLSSNGLGVTVSWSAVSGATGYNVYGRATGSSGQKLLASKVLTTNWLDLGTASNPLISPPSVNTTSLNAWTSSPPSPLITQSTLLREVGRRKSSLTTFVIPDNTNGSISTLNGRWTAVSYPTQYIYVYTAFDLTDALNSTIYQFGYFIGTVPNAGNASTLYLTPGQIANPGTLLSLENVTPIIRDNSSKETHDTVMTF